MMQVADIKTALKDDTIFNAINKEFLSLDLDDVKNNNQDLQKIFKKLIEAMKRESPLFNETFQRIMWAGSYYKKTRVEKPNEYDINFVINLPIKTKFMSDCPGYIKIKRTDDLPNVSKASNNKEMKSFIDDDSYLNQEKIRTWMESILSKVARTTSGNDQYIKLDRYPQITKKKSGPAFTLNVRFSNGDFVDIDLVPVLVYPIHNPPPKCSGKFSHSYINLQGKLRDTEDCMKNIASYYIETLCLHELQIFEGSNKVSSTFLFFTMLEKFHEAFQKRCIKHYWEDFNLLENMGLDEMIIIENRLNKIIKEIKKSIKDDKFAIARFVLKKDELEKLKRVINDHATAESNPKEIQTESSNESRCIII
ncbi:cyclic GMP-AMP synthase-like receptor isoform X3 [Linepithema humile]|uniref:cyclic GMP-AMP synthase-like receptor isoform X3 n=1 Tax=Linepithema humile TaxID=83485 RepID=UPI00351DFC8C